MYNRCVEQLSKFREQYYALIQEFSQIQIDHTNGILPEEVFIRLSQAIMLEQGELQVKIEQYEYYDIFDLAMDVLYDEFRSLSDNLV